MIREATTDDIPAIIQMGSEIHAASAFSDSTYNPDVVALKAVTMINRDQSTILVAYHGVHLVGLIPAWVSPSFFSSELIACEQVIYVAPAYRRYGHGIRLIKAFIRWARGQDASDIRIGNIGGMTDDESYSKLLIRLGFSRTGGMYVMR